MPSWARTWLRRYPLQKQVHVYARIVIGSDMSSIAPNELGCAESVTRLLQQVNANLCPVYTGTWHLLDHLIHAKTQFKEVTEQEAKDGSIVIAATGTGFGLFPGHVGIIDSKRVLSNNSRTGKWDGYWSLLAFKDRYQRQGGMRIRYFAIKN